MWKNGFQAMPTRRRHGSMLISKYYSCVTYPGNDSNEFPQSSLASAIFRSRSSGYSPSPKNPYKQRRAELLKLTLNKMTNTSAPIEPEVSSTNFIRLEEVSIIPKAKSVRATKADSQPLKLQHKEHHRLHKKTKNFIQVRKKK